MKVPVVYRIFFIPVFTLIKIFCVLLYLYITYIFLHKIILQTRNFAAGLNVFNNYYYNITHNYKIAFMAPSRWHNYATVATECFDRLKSTGKRAAIVG